MEVSVIDVDNPQTFQADVLVIGGGLAGIRAAIEARKRGRNVVLVSKSPVGLRNNSAVALGGFAAAAGTGWRDPADRHEDHIRDTLESGRHVNDRRLVEAMREGGRNIQMSPPQAHFFMGGVATDERTQTDLNGLFACGEICAGVHGANRLGSNALSECLVFGARAGRHAAEWAQGAERRALDADGLDVELGRLGRLAAQKGTLVPEKLALQLRNLMWAKVGIIRDAAGLEQAIEEIRGIRGRLSETAVDGVKGFLTLLSLHSMATLSELIARAALARSESRGAHYRSDFPAEDDRHWLTNISVVKGPSEDNPLLTKGQLNFRTP